MPVIGGVQSVRFIADKGEKLPLNRIICYIGRTHRGGMTAVSHVVHLLQDDETTIADWVRRSERLHRTLRPSLPADYEGYLRRMFSEGARMAILHVSDEPKALAVYRIHHTTIQGLRFYLDDLVTDEGERGRGLGAAMLDWCIAKARTA